MKLFYRRGEVHPRLGPVQTVGMVEFALMLALTAAGMALLFLGPNSRNHDLFASGHSFFSPALSLDAALPLVPGFVWAYYAYFPGLLAIGLLTTMDRRLLYEGVLGYLGLSLISFFVFVALPSRIDQPDLSACGSLECRMLRAMYALDDGYNIFPSMHVANTTFVWLMFRRYAPPMVLPYGAHLALVSASTLLCKRHYLVDVPAGLAMGALGYALARRHGARLASALVFLDGDPRLRPRAPRRPRPSANLGGDSAGRRILYARGRVEPGTRRRGWASRRRSPSP